MHSKIQRGKKIFEEKGKLRNTNKSVSENKGSNTLEHVTPCHYLVTSSGQACRFVRVKLLGKAGERSTSVGQGGKLNYLKPV